MLGFAAHDQFVFWDQTQGNHSMGDIAMQILKNPIFAIIPAVNLMILSVTVCGNADSLLISPPGRLNLDFTSIPS